MLLARGSPRKKNGIIEHCTGGNILLEEIEEVLETRLRNLITRDNVIVMVSNGVDVIPTPSAFNKIMEEFRGSLPFLIPFNISFLSPKSLFKAEGLG